MTGTMTLLTAPLNEDPLVAADLEDDAHGAFSATRITAP